VRVRVAWTRDKYEVGEEEVGETDGRSEASRGLAQRATPKVSLRVSLEETGSQAGWNARLKKKISNDALQRALLPCAAARVATQLYWKRNTQRLTTGEARMLL